MTGGSGQAAKPFVRVQPSSYNKGVVFYDAYHTHVDMIYRIQNT